MIVSNEPGYYKEGAYGIRIETLQVVTEAAPLPGGERPMLGFETLTLAPIDRRLVAREMLTDEERAQLDAYHARVLEQGRAGGSRRRSRLARRRMRADLGSGPDQRQPLVFRQHLEAQFGGGLQLGARAGAGDHDVGLLGHR